MDFYQATARGRNLTGVFRFSLREMSRKIHGSQPATRRDPNLLTDPYNNYVFLRPKERSIDTLVQANVNVRGVTTCGDGGFNVLGAERGSRADSKHKNDC